MELRDTAITHLETEATYFCVLPAEEAAEHPKIHRRAIDLLRGYLLEDQGSGYPALTRVLTMIRAHHGSLEEMQLMDALKEALKVGRLTSRR